VTLARAPRSGAHAGPAARPACDAISDEDFALFQRLIEAESGIHLGPAKKALLVGRLARRLRDLGLASYADYYGVVAAPRGAAERVRMLDCICTNETRFFREPAHFDLLRRVAFPAWAERALRGPRWVRCWSAACATGEEPYSLAMLLRESFPAAAGWSAEVLATDLSTRALAAAERAVYTAERAADVPAHLRRRFLERAEGAAEGAVAVSEEARSIVRLRRMNLSAPVWPVSGPFDAIFCRNVLIYFAPEGRRRVIERLIDRLAPDGLLFLGHAESLHGVTDRARAIAPAAYVRADSAAAGRRP
jgi:chemotaxis protein methyltransferase CheR